MTYPSVQKTKVIKEASDIKYLKALADGAPTERLAGIFYKDLKFRPLLHRQVCQKLSQECTALCSEKNHHFCGRQTARTMEVLTGTAS